MRDIEISLRYLGNGKFQAVTSIEAEWCETNFKQDSLSIFKVIKWTEKRGRTKLQNNALWLWFTKIAKFCQDAGIEITEIMPKKLKHPVTKDNFKEDVFNPCCNAIYEHTNSSELSTVELSDLVREIDYRILMPRGINVEFPHRFNQGLEG